MKGIYLTEEGKQDIETEIADLEEHLLIKQKEFTSHVHLCGFLQKQINLLKEILSSATILPVEEDWYHVHFVLDEAGEQLGIEYPNGVIIQPE
jgi:hypothetical protein